eukprot:5003798-Prymnesium_polylepis.1
MVKQATAIGGSMMAATQPSHSGRLLLGRRRRTATELSQVPRSVPPSLQPLQPPKRCSKRVEGAQADTHSASSTPLTRTRATFCHVLPSSS